MCITNFADVKFNPVPPAFNECKSPVPLYFLLNSLTKLILSFATVVHQRYLLSILFLLVLFLVFNTDVNCEKIIFLYLLQLYPQLYLAVLFPIFTRYNFFHLLMMDQDISVLILLSKKK